MTRGRFLLRFGGDRARPEEDLKRIRDLPEATVLDESAPRTLLVESDEQPLRALVESMPGWVIAPEREIPLPDTRKRIRRPPG